MPRTDRPGPGATRSTSIAKQFTYSILHSTGFCTTDSKPKLRSLALDVGELGDYKRVTGIDHDGYRFAMLV